MCINIRSPAQTYLGRLPDFHLPSLNRLSDVLFLNWKRLAGSDPNRIAGLKYVLHYYVTNRDTKAVISEIESRSLTRIKNWPGRVFPITKSNKNGLALLGTPNGSGIAYFLFQHKDYFPEKTISKVRVWKSPEWNGIWVHMLFYIEDLDNVPQTGNCLCS
jgi:hypothetical protein